MHRVFSFGVYKQTKAFRLSIEVGLMPIMKLYNPSRQRRSAVLETLSTMCHSDWKKVTNVFHSWVDTFFDGQVRNLFHIFEKREETFKTGNWRFDEEKLVCGALFSTGVTWKFRVASICCKRQKNGQSFKNHTYFLSHTLTLILNTTNFLPTKDDIVNPTRETRRTLLCLVSLWSSTMHVPQGMMSVW